ncbi:hypothetical protein Q0A17_04170 [Citrobacter sp. S2-9]|uniref:Uncharacterized protein n=1 Tax=Citrobacter enshiensis TaxID=2971264 RepID=A0ABT8PQU4_9ENTR|nr:hypothetical protein [Citrobacter enshiensis]MDN8598618.1 hypothetical protein [Citrobacter enshiensis]
MARKVQTVTISAEGRDKGKVFLITEMPASRAEKWALRALLAIGRGGVQLPEGIEKMGFAGIVSYGINLITQLPYEEAEYLLAEMFTCVQIMPDPARPQIVRAVQDDDIEEVATRITLRKEIFGLHSDFLKAVGKSTTASTSPNLPTA